MPVLCSIVADLALAVALNWVNIFKDAKGNLHPFDGSTVGLGDTVIVKKHVNEFVNANIIDSRGREYLKNVYLKASDLNCAMY